MTTISTTGYPDITPLLITGYAVSRAIRTVVHDTIDPGASAPYVSLATAALRTGTLEVLFASQDEALDCFNRHALRLVHTFHQPQRHTMDMRYVVAGGELTLELDDDTRTLWLVGIPFHEVSS